MIRSSFVFLALGALCACSAPPTSTACQSNVNCAAGETCTDGVCVAEPVDAGTGGSGGSGGGGAGGGGGGGVTGGGNGGGGAEQDAGCTARTCAGLGCGVFTDGCGGMLTCTDSCECTEQNFDTACPSRPCLNLAGCVDFKCSYAPTSCQQPDAGTATCAPTTTCSGAGCGRVCTNADGGCDDKLYACGGGICAGVEAYCDPSPAVMNGKVVFANRCIAPPKVGCGTCQLGTQSCDLTNDRFACSELDIPVADAGVVECDSTVSASTFLYVDPAYTGSSDGSRMRPFVTFGAATTAASARGARGIIIGGNPTFTEPLVVPNGVSIYGGFGVSPLFVPDASKRPQWNIGATALDVANNRLVGASATNVTLATLVRHLDVRTANVTANTNGRGASNLGFVVVNSPALQLDDVIISAGNAGAGVDGTPGVGGATGGNAAGRVPGTVSCGGAPVTCTVNTPIANQGGNDCGRGGKDQINFSSVTGNPGNGGTPIAAGGTFGPGVNDQSACGGSSSSVPNAGGFGGNGLTGSAGSVGSPGVRVTVSAAGLIAGGVAASGTSGGVGTFGGGGGAGGGYFDSCLNSPDWGGPGGGGGAPGCGGERGLTGGPGGLSIGLLVGNSAGFSVTASVRVTAGNGGRGGTGGAGGSGGMGGNGETSTLVRCVSSSNPNYAGKCGGSGGRGGNGGNGGGAGGSAGGDSVGIYCVGGAVPSATGATVNVGTPGVGGSATAPAQPGASGGNELRKGC